MMTIMAESMADRIVSAEDEGPEPGRNDFFLERKKEKNISRLTRLLILSTLQGLSFQVTDLEADGRGNSFFSFRK